MHFCLAILAVAVSLGLGAVAAPMPADVAVVAAVSDLAVTKVVTDPLDVVEDVLDELDVHVSSILPMLDIETTAEKVVPYMENLAQEFVNAQSKLKTLAPAADKDARSEALGEKLEDIIEDVYDEVEKKMSTLASNVEFGKAMSTMVAKADSLASDTGILLVLSIDIAGLDFGVTL